MQAEQVNVYCFKKLQGRKKHHKPKLRETRSSSQSTVTDEGDSKENLTLPANSAGDDYTNEISKTEVLFRGSRSPLVHRGIQIYDSLCPCKETGTEAAGCFCGSNKVAPLKKETVVSNSGINENITPSGNRNENNSKKEEDNEKSWMDDDASLKEEEKSKSSREEEKKSSGKESGNEGSSHKLNDSEEGGIFRRLFKTKSSDSDDDSQLKTNEETITRKESDDEILKKSKIILDEANESSQSDKEKTANLTKAAGISTQVGGFEKDGQERTIHESAPSGKDAHTSYRLPRRVCYRPGRESSRSPYDASYHGSWRMSPEKEHSFRNASTGIPKYSRGTSSYYDSFKNKSIMTDSSRLGSEKSPVSKYSQYGTPSNKTISRDMSYRTPGRQEKFSPSGSISSHEKSTQPMTPGGSADQFKSPSRVTSEKGDSKVVSSEDGGQMSDLEVSFSDIREVEKRNEETKRMTPSKWSPQKGSPRDVSLQKSPQRMSPHRTRLERMNTQRISPERMSPQTMSFRKMHSENTYDIDPTMTPQRMYPQNNMSHTRRTPQKVDMSLQYSPRSHSPHSTISERMSPHVSTPRRKYLNQTTSPFSSPYQTRSNQTSPKRSFYSPRSPKDDLESEIPTKDISTKTTRSFGTSYEMEQSETETRTPCPKFKASETEIRPPCPFETSLLTSKSADIEVDCACDEDLSFLNFKPKRTSSRNNLFGLFMRGKSKSPRRSLIPIMRSPTSPARFSVKSHSPNTKNIYSPSKNKSNNMNSKSWKSPETMQELHKQLADLASTIDTSSETSVTLFATKYANNGQMVRLQLTVSPLKDSYLENEEKSKMHGEPHDTESDPRYPYSVDKMSLPEYENSYRMNKTAPEPKSNKTPYDFRLNKTAPELKYHKRNDNISPDHRPFREGRMNKTEPEARFNRSIREGRMNKTAPGRYNRTSSEDGNEESVPESEFDGTSPDGGLNDSSPNERLNKTFPDGKFEKATQDRRLNKTFPDGKFRKTAPDGRLNKTAPTGRHQVSPDRRLNKTTPVKKFEDDKLNKSSPEHKFHNKSMPSSRNNSPPRNSRLNKTNPDNETSKIYKTFPVQKIQIYHNDNDIQNKLQQIGFTNLMKIAKPANCARKAHLNEGSHEELPYPASLISLPLDQEDVKTIKQSVSNTKDSNRFNYVTSYTYETCLSKFEEFTNIPEGEKFPWAVPSYELRFFDFFKKDEAGGSKKGSSTNTATPNDEANRSNVSMTSRFFSSMRKTLKDAYCQTETPSMASVYEGSSRAKMTRSKSEEPRERTPYSLTQPQCSRVEERNLRGNLSMNSIRSTPIVRKSVAEKDTNRSTYSESLHYVKKEKGDHPETKTKKGMRNKKIQCIRLRSHSSFTASSEPTSNNDTRQRKFLKVTNLDDPESILSNDKSLSITQSRSQPNIEAGMDRDYGSPLLFRRPTNQIPSVPDNHLPFWPAAQHNITAYFYAETESKKSTSTLVPSGEDDRKDKTPSTEKVVQAFTIEQKGRNPCEKEISLNSIKVITSKDKNHPKNLICKINPGNPDLCDRCKILEEIQSISNMRQEVCEHGRKCAELMMNNRKEERMMGDRKREGERKSGDRYSSERERIDRERSNDRFGTERVSSDCFGTPSEHFGSERISNNRLPRERTSSDRFVGDRSSSDRFAGERSSSERYNSERNLSNLTERKCGDFANIFPLGQSNCSEHEMNEITFEISTPVGKDKKKIDKKQTRSNHSLSNKGSRQLLENFVPSNVQHDIILEETSSDDRSSATSLSTKSLIESVKITKVKSTTSGMCQYKGGIRSAGYLSVLKPACGCPEISVFVPCFCNKSCGKALKETTKPLTKPTKPSRLPRRITSNPKIAETRTSKLRQSKFHGVKNNSEI